MFIFCDIMKHFVLPLLLFLLCVLKQNQAFVAEIDVELVSFVVLNPNIASVGTECDSRYINGAYNPCDFVFYIEDCRRSFETLPGYVCNRLIDRLYATSNMDDVNLEQLNPRPVVRMLIEGQYPQSVMLNITVYDQDDGYSWDDFVGSYCIDFPPSVLNRQPNARLPGIENVITIPGHSRLVVRYNAYCLDADCSARQQFQVANYVPSGACASMTLNSAAQIGSSFIGGGSQNLMLPRPPQFVSDSQQQRWPLDNARTGQLVYRQPLIAGKKK